MSFDVGGDQRLALVHCPFVHTASGVMNVPVEEFAVVGIIHNLPDCRTRAFRNDAVDYAFAFGHPSAGKTHVLLSNLAQTGADYDVYVIDHQYVQRNPVYSMRVQCIKCKQSCKPR